MKIINHAELFPTSLVQPILDIFNKSIVWLTNDSVIVFLCGRAVQSSDPKQYTARQVLMEYLQKHFNDFNYFLAEDVFKDLKDNQRDLLSLEHDLAESSDCIIIILESAGAIAELGAFAMQSEIVEKLIIVNENSFKNEPSFINVGPIAKTNKKSKYGSVIYADLNVIGLVGSQIGDRIKKVNAQSLRRKMISGEESMNFDNWPKKDQILFIHDLIWFFYPVSKANLIVIFNSIFKITKIRITTIIELLCAMKLVKKKDDYLISPCAEKLFIRYNNRHVLIRAKVLNHYHRNRKYFGKELDLLKNIQ